MPLSKTKVILVEPRHSGNIGSVARLCTNFGVSKMILVNPQVDFLSDDARKLARKKGKRVLETSKTVSSLEEAFGDIGYSIGTTSRIGGDKNLFRVAVHPRDLNSANIDWENLCLVFGREDNGLTTEEAQKCNTLVTLPASPTFPVLNLSHAVAIILWELSNLGTKKDTFADLKHRPALLKERNFLVHQFEHLLDVSSYKEIKKHISAQAFKNMVSRSYITGREAHTLIGTLKHFRKSLEQA